MFHIYCYENLINGKIYIGQTCNMYNRRSSHKNGHGAKDNLVLDRAIIKHGIENFSNWIIHTVSTREEANSEETFWIDEMRSKLGKDMIYNVSSGGHNRPAGWSGKKHSIETRNKISATLKGRPAPWVSEANKRRDATKNLSNNCKGKTWKIINNKRIWMEK